MSDAERIYGCDSEQGRAKLAPSSSTSSHDDSLSSTLKETSAHSDSNSFSEVRLNSASSSSSPDERAREFLFPNTHSKDNVKPPNVTVMHPSAQHPLFGARLPGSSLPPFAAPSSLTRQHEEFLRHSLLASAHAQHPFASSKPSTDQLRALSAHAGADGAHLSSAHAHMQHVYLQNYYAAAALQHLQRSRLASGEMPHRLAASSRFAPYAVQHAHSATRQLPLHQSRDHTSPNSPERLSPNARQSASGSQVTSFPSRTSSSPSSDIQELSALRRSVQRSPGTETMTKGHSPRTNKFSIESLTAKD